ncbi:MAG: nucleotidyltransferase family protein [Pseudomonadales bacterium]|nr:nucleotidyltransferase family protein [Pseudomonadales bacterium]
MIDAIMLAAGNSKRFGRDKRRAVLASGESVLLSSINNVIDEVEQLLVVLRSDDAEYATQLKHLVNNPGLSFLCAPDSAKGIGHSLANAIHTISQRKTGLCQAAFIFLADMPYVNRTTIQSMRSEYTARQSNKPIILPSMAGKTGHPVLFSQSYFNQLKNLSGDQGARRIVNAHPEQVFRVDVIDPGIFLDIDRPADIALMPPAD